VGIVGFTKIMVSNMPIGHIFVTNKIQKIILLKMKISSTSDDGNYFFYLLNIRKICQQLTQSLILNQEFIQASNRYFRD